MAYRTLEGLKIHDAGRVQCRENRSNGVFYTTEFYHYTSGCCYSNEPCFGTLPNRGTYYSRGCTVSVHLAEVDCNGQKRTRHWIRVSPTDDSDWDTDVQAPETYETLQKLLNKGSWSKWLGEPITSQYRHGSLEARPGLTTRDGSWYQCQRTSESAQKPQYCSVFRHEWSKKCEGRKSCFEDCDNKCCPTWSHGFVLEAGKARGRKRCSHIIKITSETEDIWEGEQAGETLLELEDLVNGCGGGSEKNKLYWLHPRWRYEKLRERRNRGNLFFLLVCLFMLALEVGFGKCRVLQQFRGTFPP